MATQVRSEALVKSLNDLCDKYPFQTGWYFKDLSTGETADRDGDVVVPSASTRKIAILMTALKAVNEGKLSLDQPIPIQAKYQDNNSGVFQHLQPGFILPLRDHLVMMIIVQRAPILNHRCPTGSGKAMQEARDRWIELERCSVGLGS